MERVEPSELEKGDIFSEDRYPEKYKVVGFTSIGGHPGVVGENLETGERCRFGGESAYSPALIRHE